MVFPDILIAGYRFVSFFSVVHMYNQFAIKLIFALTDRQLMKILKDRTKHLESRVAIAQNEASEMNYAVIILAVAGIIGIIIGIYVYNLLIIILSLIAMQIAWTTNKKSQRAIEAPKKGISGEDAVIEVLKRLDDTYYLINDIILKQSQSHGNIDHLLLGPNGIFVIETKNYNGTIKCNGDDWTRIYPTKSYQTSSPSRQAKRNAVILRNFLRDRTDAIRKWPNLFINGIVVFTGYKVNLKLDNPTVDVLKIDELVDYILNTKSNIQFADEDIGSLARFILNASQ
jgi:xanthosine utilization system XapX-like protein